MTTLNDWDNAPSPPGDPTLHAHKLGLHDVPEDDCPACRVDRGAALLDERRPGWWEDVDLGRLDLESCDRCTLGQVYGDYIGGASDLNLYYRGSAPYDYGFDLTPSEPEENYNLLTDLWRSKISERRAR